MKHTTFLKIDGCKNGTFKTLAREIVNLRYDALAELLREIADCLHEDATKDFKAGKKQLSYDLEAIKVKICNAAEYAENAWTICEPYMKE